MSASRETRLAETWQALGGPLARLKRSLLEDEKSLPVRGQAEQSGPDSLAVDAFLQRFQQVTNIVLRKLFPRLLAVLEADDAKRAFGAMLDRLDGYAIIDDVGWWTELNAIRNRLIHEYAMVADARADELRFAWTAAAQLVTKIDLIRNHPALNVENGQ